MSDKEPANHDKSPFDESDDEDQFRQKMIKKPIGLEGTPQFFPGQGHQMSCQKYSGALTQWLPRGLRPLL